jgi:thiosulfate/3-mercaptopyruvate sulfurtransferase
MFTTLISARQLTQLSPQHPPLALFDCSFDLMNPALGAEQYHQAHLPGARHADLDRHLSNKSGAADNASGGRHPLPSREAFAAWLRSMGVSNDSQVVVYDRQGANYCGRLWWMLKWCGHEAVAVLDGGLSAWQQAGGALRSGADPAPLAGDFSLRPSLARLTDKVGVAQALGHSSQTIIDARAGPRFRGEVEPLDPVPGHIPGALNRPFQGNLGPDGRFKPVAQLREEFDALLAGRDPSSVVHHCGSGVSAIPNLLAMELAGLGRAALYAGSWSEWCRDPSLPVARG